MEIDTGSSITLIQKDTYDELFSELKMAPTKTVLKIISGELFRPLKTIKVTVEINGQRQTDNFIRELW